MSTTLSHTIPLDIEPEIYHQAQERSIKLPHVMFTVESSPPFSVPNQLNLLDGIAELSQTPSYIVIASGDLNFAPNPDIEITGRSSFVLSYNERLYGGLTSERFNEKFWLGCLTLNSLSSESETGAYRKRMQALKLSNLALGIVSLASIPVLEELPPNIQHPGFFTAGLILLGTVAASYKYRGNIQYEYFKKKNTEQARAMAEAFPVLEYTNEPNPVTNLNAYRQARKLKEKSKD